MAPTQNRELGANSQKCSKYNVEICGFLCVLWAAGDNHFNSCSIIVYKPNGSSKVKWGFEVRTHNPSQWLKGTVYLGLGPCC